MGTTTLPLIATLSLAITIILILALAVHGFSQPGIEEKMKRKYAKKLIGEMKLGKIEPLTELLSNNGKKLHELFNTEPQNFSVHSHMLNMPTALNLPSEFGDLNIWICSGKDYYHFQNKNLKEIEGMDLNFYDRELIAKIVELVLIQQNNFKIQLEIQAENSPLKKK